MIRNGDVASADDASADGDGFERAMIAETARLLRLLLTAVDHAPDGVLTLSADSPLVGLARRLIKGTPAEIECSRTATMALRDLVWRVDSARSLLEQRAKGAEREELRLLLATDDIHQFLGQEHRSDRKGGESARRW